MVALHNKRLTHADLFRGVLWSDKEWHDLRDTYHAQLVEEGVDSIALQFKLSRMMDAYQQTQPSMKERQQIYARLFPPKVCYRPLLEEEEIDWLMERLDGVNDPIGVDILNKLKALRK